MTETKANEVRFGGFFTLSDLSNLSDAERDLKERIRIQMIRNSLSSTLSDYAEKDDCKRLFFSKYLSWELVIKGHE